LLYPLCYRGAGQIDADFPLLIKQLVNLLVRLGKSRRRPVIGVYKC
jgi:hypothetical protein